jgi:hypothetical protein
MFWTAFIWGLGVSFGASFGLMSFVILKWIWDATANAKPVRRAGELAELANAALVRRNQLTEQQIAKLGEIAEIIDEVGAAMQRDR